ncbi:histidine kinase [Streptomyces sp. TRM76323]|uniref:histidine kinase n=1 Tax=Streptomyces tamarix TaxID=3078565 RepID=A0ABU3QIE5_9ACTN|nr:histidine kinase [Streptomyces tamarix]MDT9682531.1 histidine kinase [Streptomyces tamarix]
MTETTQRTAPGGRSPEFHHAAELLRGLREDLLQDALAYRPLPPMAVDGPVTRRLPGRIRRYAVWAPHALVAAAALMAFSVGYDTTGFFPVALVPAAAVLLTLVRPVAAFWASLLTASAYAAVVGGDGAWPPTVFFSHVVVMTVVAARTRPRAAAWMWAVTGVYGLFVEGVLGGGYGGVGTANVLFAAAFTLLVVTVWQVRRAAREEVTAQRTATAQERSMRTLLEERTTIARELHDVVAHHMSVVAIQAEAAPYRVENPPPELEQAFVTIRENAVAALTELRRVLGVVRAEDYEAPDAPQPTLADLDGLLANVRDAGLAVDKTVTGAVRELPPGVELSAYRIVQEALSNVLRHAPGAAARVEVSYVLGGLGLRVVNGPPRGLGKPSPGAGHGITGMRERIAMLDGELTAGATEDGGYEVAAFVPVARDEAAA